MGNQSREPGHYDDDDDVINDDVINDKKAICESMSSKGMGKGRR
jgi:hypothetical protein